MAATSSRGHIAKGFRVDGLQIGDRHYYPNTAPQLFRYHNEYYAVPRGPSFVFTGRAQICGRLQARSLPSVTSPQGGQKRYFIHGLGGSGKTQLCLKFVEDHCEEFWGIFWIDASTEANIERRVARITQICRLEIELDPVKLWLSNIPELWDLIFDNADDPQLDISHFFPVGDRGSILITTRGLNSKIHATVGSSELGRLETDEATTLPLRTSDLEDSSDQGVQKAAKQVVSILDCFALAIAHTGALIRNGRCRIEEYHEFYS